jgi:hypothetical protein
MDGWFIGDCPEKLHKQYIKHKFVNSITNEVKYLTTLEFLELTGHYAYGLISGNVSHLEGWCYETKKEVKYINKRKQKYHLVNEKTGEEFIGTRREFQEYTKMSQAGATNTIKGRRKNFGWVLIGEVD